MTEVARIGVGPVAPLNTLAEEWRHASDGVVRSVPWFDPASGGVEARVLVLFERPAASTISDGDAGVSSEDNRSPSSAVFARARQDSGLSRTDYVRWNIIPWDSDSATRPPLFAELDEAGDALHQLLGVLPRLRGIVTLGQVALTGVMRYLTLHPDPIIRPVLAAPHPSPANAHRRDELELRIANALQRAMGTDW